MIAELVTRMRFLLFRGRRSDVEEELRFHVEESIAMNVAAGMPLEEARRQALVDFGGADPGAVP